MGAFVCAVWDTPHPPRAAALGHKAAQRAGWDLITEQEGFWAFRGGPRPPDYRRLGSGLVVGDLFFRHGAAVVPTSEEGETLARRLSRDAWGRYVLLTLEQDGRPSGIFRDPSGGLDLFHWSDGQGCRWIASDTPGWLLNLFPNSWSIDWARVTAIVQDPTRLSDQPALLGMAAVPPGAFQRLGIDGPPQPVLSLAAMANGPPLPAYLAGRALVKAVDQVALSWSRVLPSITMEISGGLDSAIVGSALRRAGARVTRWAHAWGPGDVYDERPYARAVAEKLGATLTELERPGPSSGIESWLSHEKHPRLHFGRLDDWLDGRLAALAGEAGAVALLGGGGGDAVFCQQSSASLFGEARRVLGFMNLFDPSLRTLARRGRRSVWSVWREAGAAERALPGPGRPPLALSALPSTLDDGQGSAWLGDLTSLSPAKRLQVQGVASLLMLHGPCRRTEAADVIHPLLCQPVLEACLATPIQVLTQGGHDRALARDAFATRLPEIVAARRSKGELTAHFARLAASNLDTLRPHLLEGQLVQAGLLDRARLEEALSMEGLIWKTDIGDLILAAALESWVQAWS